MGVAIRTLDVETGEERDILDGTPEHEAHLEWARFHGLDPHVIPAGSLVVRDGPACCVRYERYAFDTVEDRLARNYAALVLYADDTGRVVDSVRVRVVEQGEAPPLPFPKC